MSNRRVWLWLPLLAVAFAGLPFQAVAAEYAVVANYGAGTVSLIQNSGSGWTGTPDSALSVGGLPWGVATSGRYAFVANNNGYVDVLQAGLDYGSDRAALASVQTLAFGSSVEWVSAGNEGKVYVSTRSGDGGALWELSRSADTWSSSLLSNWDYFLPRGISVVPATLGSPEKLVITKKAAPGAGEHSVQVLQDGTAISDYGFSDGLRPMQVTPWIAGTQQFALVTRQSPFANPPEGSPHGYLTAMNLATGMPATNLLLPYSPYAVAVVGGNAYVSDFESSLIYKYSLSMSDTPTMTLLSSLSLGGFGGVRQILDSGDGHLLVTSNTGSTIYSIDLDNYGAGGVTQVAGTYSGVVGIGLIDPLAAEPAVPEPSSIATLATGLLAAAGGALRRKGRRKEG